MEGSTTTRPRVKSQEPRVQGQLPCSVTARPTPRSLPWPCAAISMPHVAFTPVLHTSFGHASRTARKGSRLSGGQPVLFVSIWLRRLITKCLTFPVPEITVSAVSLGTRHTSMPFPLTLTQREREGERKRYLTGQ